MRCEGARRWTMCESRRERVVAGREKVARYTSRGQDKEQQGELRAFVVAVETGAATPVPLTESILTALAAASEAFWRAGVASGDRGAVRNGGQGPAAAFAGRLRPRSGAGEEVSEPVLCLA